MNFVKLDPLLHSRPKMVAVGWWGRQLFIHLVMLSGKYDLRGRFAPHYLKPEWLRQEWGHSDSHDELPNGWSSWEALLDAHLRSLVLNGVLVLDGEDLVIQKWDEFYSGKDFSTPRVKAFRARSAGGTEAAPPEKGETLQDNTKQDETTPDGGPMWLARMWNETLGDVLPRVTKVSGERERHAKARCAEYTKADIVAALTKVRGIPGLLGKAPVSPTHGNWKAGFDWFVGPLSIAKILEGKYDQWGTKPPDNHPTPLIKDPTKLYD